MYSYLPSQLVHTPEKFAQSLSVAAYIRLAEWPGFAMSSYATAEMNPRLVEIGSQPATKPLRFSFKE